MDPSQGRGCTLEVRTDEIAPKSGQPPCQSDQARMVGVFTLEAPRAASRKASFTSSAKVFFSTCKEGHTRQHWDCNTTSVRGGDGSGLCRRAGCKLMKQRRVQRDREAARPQKSHLASRGNMQLWEHLVEIKSYRSRRAVTRDDGSTPGGPGRRPTRWGWGHAGQYLHTEREHGLWFSAGPQETLCVTHKYHLRVVALAQTWDQIEDPERLHCKHTTARSGKHQAIRTALQVTVQRHKLTIALCPNAHAKDMQQLGHRCYGENKNNTQYLKRLGRIWVLGNPEG